MRWICVFSLVALPALADETGSCPPAPDHEAEIAGLLDDLASVRTPERARVVLDALWRLWTDAPDERAQALLDEGMRRREGYDFLGARDILDDLVEYCPDYAEGYNQRAFASFLRQDLALALADLDIALELNPTHIGALSGKALTLIGLGREDEAQEVLRRAVELNPFLAERALLRDPPGTDI